MTYIYTQDWFSRTIPLFEKLELKEINTVLEIGSFEGRSAVWFADNILAPDGTLICVDTWLGGEEHGVLMEGVEEKFDKNMELLDSKNNKLNIIKAKGTSYEMITRLYANGNIKENTLDLVYIDGSHLARDVLSDACLVWPLVKPGGFVVFDDYCWGSLRDFLHRPKGAIDAFSNFFAETLDIVHVGYQYAVRKREVDEA